MAAYAAREGIDVAAYTGRAGPALTAGQVGQAILDLAADGQEDHGAYLLRAGGLSPAP